MEDILGILPTIIQYAPAVAVLIGLLMAYARGMIVSRQTLLDLRSIDQKYVTDIKQLIQDNEKKLDELYKLLLQERQARLETSESRLQEQGRLATLGLQFMVASQHSQDNATGLLANIEALLNKHEEM